MCEDIRKLVGNEYVKKDAEFSKGIENLQQKYSDYFVNKDPHELTYYITTYAKDGSITMKIDPELRTDIVKEVKLLFNLTWGG